MLNKKFSKTVVWVPILVSVLVSCESGGVHEITLGDGALTEAGSAKDLGTREKIYDDSVCAFQSQEVGLLPLDMLLVLDTSYSMDFESKWFAIKEAVKAFASDSQFDGLGVGIQYFPLRKQCSIEAYGDPAVPIGTLPLVSSSISASLDEQRMFGGTPMVPMLDGTIAYAREWMNNNPKRKAVIVLATDGIPDKSCLTPEAGGLPNTIENVVKLATDGVASEPPVPTFVIGVGTELTALNEISQAGNGSDAILVDATKNLEAAFLAALTAVRKRALICDYEIPAPQPGVKVDYDHVNVGFTSGGETETFVRVSGKGDCALSPKNAWYYDKPDNPEKIILCSETCEKVQATQDGELQFQFGCKTIIL
ncbi:MAG: hypothetical protein V1754_03880 [Pseudomonadota bacterium]